MKHIMKFFPFLTLTALLVAPLASLQAVDTALTLVVEGRPRAAIVLADNPSAAAESGASLFAAQIERISGARLPVVKERDLRDVKTSDGFVHATIKGGTPEVFVFIGESSLTKQLGATPDGLGAGGILLRTFDNGLVLLGPDDKTPSDPNGTRYAVTTFLEDALGFRIALCKNEIAINLSVLQFAKFELSPCIER
ncbi:MAG: hypothetical protein SGI77_02040 [Pirellulaceae bacterium]|nr:hypothetical protein [Pirellulaceae bacterium]